MMRKLSALMAVTALAVAFLLGAFHTGGHTPEADAAPDVTLSIDADLTDGTGPCNPITDSITIDPAVVSTHLLGLCIEGQPAAPQAFDLTVLYDNALNEGPDVACTAPCLDSNPDANDGDSPGGTKLGGGWDCTGFGLNLPTGDGPGAGGDARIVCNANVISPDADLTADPGLMATLTFNVIGGGVDTLRFTNTGDTGFATSSVDAAICGMEPTTCVGATITKEGPTPTPSNTPTNTATPTATPTPCFVDGATCTPTPTPKGGRLTTQTPTPTDTATPTPAEPEPSPTSPPPAETPPLLATATATPFGGPAAVVVPPLTGTGTDSGGSASLVWALAITLSVAGLGGLALAGRVYRRWIRSRS